MKWNRHQFNKTNASCFRKLIGSEKNCVMYHYLFRIDVMRSIHLHFRVYTLYLVISPGEGGSTLGEPRFPANIIPALAPSAPCYLNIFTFVIISKCTFDHCNNLRDVIIIHELLVVVFCGLPKFCHTPFVTSQAQRGLTRDLPRVVMLLSHSF